MRKFITCIIIILWLGIGQLQAQSYQPGKENLHARDWFEDARFGIMLHLGLYSLLAGGGETEPAEWILRSKENGLPPK